MTYAFPDGLIPLRNWLKAQGVNVRSIKTERQAAFMVQSLSNQRFKFPADKSASLFPLMKRLQDIICTGAPAARPVPTRANGNPKPRLPRKRGSEVRTIPEELFSGSGHELRPRAAPLGIDRGLVLFADGCCEPNPGAGGWGFVAYCNGVEIHTDSGGDPHATNQTMELTAALEALRWFAARGIVEPIRLISDSMYTVNGCNSWRLDWKARGWRRKGKDPAIANLELWQALDEALMLVPIRLEWCKGHAGIVGNERADELSQIGRDEALSRARPASVSAIEQQLGCAI